MFIKVSSYSNLITHMFVISLHVVRFTTPFINLPSTCCFLLYQALHLFKFFPLGKMENFIQPDYFCRYIAITVVPSLSAIEISGVVCKKTTLKSQITGRVVEV